jgi:hypothetical protein
MTGGWVIHEGIKSLFEGLILFRYLAGLQADRSSLTI